MATSPGARRRARRDVRGGERERRQRARRQRAAGVEAEPAKPQEAAAEDGHGQVMRDEALAPEAQTLADVDGADERAHARRPVHHRATREVEHAQLEEPPALGPRPVRHGVVHERGPQEGEEHVGAELHALHERTGDERRGDDGELELEGHEDQVGDGAPRLRGHVVQHQEVSTPDEASVRLAEGQRVAEHHPLHRHQRHGEEGVHERGEYVLAPHHAAVEERQTRRHQQHQRGGHQHPRRVTGVGNGLGCLGVRERRRQQAKHRRQAPDPSHSSINLHVRAACLDATRKSNLLCVSA